MDRLRMRSVGKTEENIKSWESCSPACLVERQGKNGAVEYGIDFAMLRQELSPVLQEGEERYQFTWAGQKTLHSAREYSGGHDSAPPAARRAWILTAHKTSISRGDNLMCSSCCGKPIWAK